MKKNRSWKGNGWEVDVLFSRAGLSTVILLRLENGSMFLLDCGDGCTRDLVNCSAGEKKNYSSLKGLKGILLTHDHFDHVGGLHTLLGFLRMIGHESDLRILFPKDSLAVKVLISGFKETYPDSTPYRIIQNHLTGGENINICGIKVNPFPVIHCGSTKKSGIGKPKPALGYKLIYNQQTIAYTGDCGLASNLEAHIKGADLLLIEATLDEPGGNIEQRVHLSAANAERLSRLAKKSFIIHRP